MSKIRLYHVIDSEYRSEAKDIPLKHVDVHANVVDQIVQFELTQHYENTETTPLEIFYTFPTPAYASVYDAVFQIGDRTVRAVVKEKESAKAEYNEAVSRGNGAYYMDRSDGDIFHVALGNVPPGAEIRVSIKCGIYLRSETDASQLRLIYPLTIMPKYTPANENRQHGKLVNPPKINERPYTMNITGSIHMSNGLVSINSLSSKIKLSNFSSESTDFMINDLENLDNDIVISISRKKPVSSGAYQTTTLPITDEKYRFCTMVNIVPDFSKTEKPTPEKMHYTLILDRSGSMQGKPMEKCKEAASFFMCDLPIGSSFDLYAFDDAFEKYKHPNGENVCTVENKATALKWIEKIRSDGGTELLPVLKDAYESAKNSNKCGVFLVLTDGGISNTTEVFRLIKANPNINVFTIGIGNNVSQQLVQGMADEGHGVAEFINAEDAKAKVKAQLSRSLTSARRFQEKNKIVIEVDGDYRMVPETIPPLFESDNNIFFIYSAQPIRSIKYVQPVDSYEITHNVELIPYDRSDNIFHRLAGIRLTEALSNNKPGSALPHLSQDVYKSEIVRISTEFGFLTQYTAFIGVETRDQKTNEPAEVREVPLQVNPRFAYGNDRGQIMKGGRRKISICSVNKVQDKSMGSGGFVLYGGNSVQDQYEAINALSASVRDSLQPMCSVSTCSAGSNVDAWGATADRLMHYSVDIAEECCDKLELLDDSGVSHKPAKKSKVDYSSAIVVNVKLSNYTMMTVMGNVVLTATINGTFPAQVFEGDIIRLTLEGQNNGVYRVSSCGSISTPWVLEKLE